MLGPTLFSIYTLLLAAIFRKHNIQYHLYADDTQLYVDLSGTRDGEATHAVDRIERCIEEARQWMSDHNLLLNDNKTEVLSSRHQIVNTCKMSRVFMYADVTLFHHRPSATSGLRSTVD